MWWIYFFVVLYMSGFKPRNRSICGLL